MAYSTIYFSFVNILFDGIKLLSTFPFRVSLWDVLINCLPTKVEIFKKSDSFIKSLDSSSNLL